MLLICTFVQAHCVKEQAASFGDFRQAMLAGADAAIREAGAQLAVPTALYYNAQSPSDSRPGGSKASSDDGSENSW